jgi:hypothetical protein
MDTVTLYEAYARLVALKNNIPDNKNIKDIYVSQYHELIDILESSSDLSLKGFRIPDNALKRHQKSYNPNTYETTFTDERYCERSMLLLKLEALIMFFEMQTNPSEKRPIGFNPSLVD